MNSIGTAASNQSSRLSRISRRIGRTGFLAISSRKPDFSSEAAGELMQISADQNGTLPADVSSAHPRQELPMLRQLLAGAAVSTCNIAVHALVKATHPELARRVLPPK
jgi:hypothetical protein